MFILHFLGKTDKYWNVTNSNNVEVYAKYIDYAIQDKVFHKLWYAIVLLD